MNNNLSPHQFTPAIQHGEQLPMFMTPHEIGGMLAADYDGHMHEVPKRMRGIYAHQAARDAGRGYSPEPSKLDHISEQVKQAGGVETPVRVKHIQQTNVASLYDGHHRAVAAMEQDKLIPVEHYFDHHAAMHDIRKDNRDTCDTCGKVPTEYWKG